MLLKGEMFLAWRYLKPQKSMISLLTYTSLLGPILGVGILIVVVSVMNGIPRELEEKLVSYNAHITISSRKPLDNVSSIMSHLDEKYQFKNSPVILAPVLIEAPNGDSEVLVTKGIVPERDEYVSKLNNMIIEGVYAIAPNEVIISHYIQEKLNIKTGDEVLLHSPEKYKRQLENSDQNAAAGKFKVSAIFSTGVPEIDKNFMVCHFNAAADLMVLSPNQATQIELALENPHEAVEVSEKLQNDDQLSKLSITPWQYQHNVTNLYRWVNDQKAMMTFVLFFIVIGAAIGVAACLFSLVIQKTKEIGILKATGVKPGAIIAVFLFMGGFLGSVGAALGLGGGLLTLKYRNKVTEVFGLWDRELYKLENVPVYYDFSDISTILIITILICLLASTIPAILAAAVHPVKALTSKG